jgi:hypothetical protein
MRLAHVAALLIAGTVSGFVVGRQGADRPESSGDSVPNGLRMDRPIVMTLTTHDGSNQVSRRWVVRAAKVRVKEDVWNIAPLQNDEPVMAISNGEYNLLCTVSLDETARYDWNEHP